MRVLGVSGSKRGGIGIDSKEVLIIGDWCLSDQGDPTFARRIYIYVFDEMH